MGDAIDVQDSKTGGMSSDETDGCLMCLHRPNVWIFTGITFLGCAEGVLLWQSESCIPIIDCRMLVYIISIDLYHREVSFLGENLRCRLAASQLNLTPEHADTRRRGIGKKGLCSTGLDCQQNNFTTYHVSSSFEDAISSQTGRCREQIRTDCP
jgi:hypothetical protein